MKKNIFLIIIILLQVNVFAQQHYSTKSRKAIKLYERAKNFYRLYNYTEALNNLEKASNADKNFVEAYWLSADIYHTLKQPDKELEYYLKAVQAGPDYSSRLYYELAEAYMRNAKYEEALQNFEKAKDFPDLHKRIKESLDYKIKQAKFCINGVKNPVPFKPVNMGNRVNTEYDDYWPLLTADESIIYTTKLIPVDMRFPLSAKNRQEDFFFNKKTPNGEWGKLYRIGKPINTKLNEGAPSISADGQWFYFTACQRPGGKGRCDIYKTRKIGNTWLTPVNLGSPVNTSAWESQPSVTADGRTLYFTSDRRGTVGNLDIWVTHLKADGTWTEPQNLGETINTPEKEMSPFIHPDGKTLYFVSNGHIGFGDQDIFISRKNDDGTWQKPVNIGWPINSEKEERGVFVNARGNLALISAVRDGNKDIDIYQFELYKDARPTPATYVSGIVRDAKTKNPIEAEFQLINIETGDTVAQNISDSKTGKYLVVLPVKNTYAFNVSKKGYLFYSDNFQLTEDYDINKPFVKNIDLQAIELGKKVVLKNIFFELDSYELKPESKIELNKLIEFLNLNPKVKIELAGHTDNQGSRSHNITLSLNRAKAVYNYLIDKGIQSGRLSYKGYGQDKPIAGNDTKEGRALNRRTEFKVIGM